MRRLGFLIVVLTILVSGCAQNESTTEVDDLIHNSSFSYDTNSKDVVKHNSTSTKAPIKYEFTARDEDENYNLEPGLYLKIFNENNTQIHSETIANEKDHSIELGMAEINPYSKTTLKPCFATKNYHENNSWSIENKNKEAVYCQNVSLSPPQIDLRIEPKPLQLNYSDIDPESPVRNVGASFNITNNGDINIRIEPDFQDRPQLELNRSKSVTETEEDGDIYVGPIGEEKYEREVRIGETIQIPVQYSPSDSELEKEKEIERVLTLLVNGESSVSGENNIKSENTTITIS